MTIAWVFPGQGSQKLGMADLVLSIDGAHERFQLASRILGRDLLAICQKENTEGNAVLDLNDTRNTQLALFVIESLLLDELKKQGSEASIVAGHSLGEIVALYAAEVFDLPTALNLLKSRSELMASAGVGAMTAILGFDQHQLFELVEQTDNVVIANDNSSDQVVLSGSKSALDLVAKKVTCKRCVPLKVSGAFHSPFMKEPADAFAREIDQITFKNAIWPVLSNSDPTPETDAIKLKMRLKQQMTSGVRWRETMEVINSKKIQLLLEIGPGKVLSGLAKRSLEEVEIKQISSSNDLGNYID